MMVVLILIFIVAVGIVIWAAASDNKMTKETADARNRQNSDMDRNIDETYRSCFGDSSQSPAEKLVQLHNTSIDILNKAKREYLASNAILTSVDTFSNLERCGISKTDFYTNLDSFRCDEIYNYKDVMENYKNVTQGRGDSYQISIGLRCYASLIKGIASKTKTTKIALDKILYYKTEGSIQHLSNVQGGGVNLQGAVAGAIIGGGAAAIIGSQLGTETKTEIVTKDDRKIMLFYKGTNGTVALEIASKNPDKTLAALRQLIPNKEETVVQLETQKNTTAVSTTSSADELRKFKELLDLGVITQEEFDAKKKQLLEL